VTQNNPQPNLSLNDTSANANKAAALRGVNLGNWLLLEKWMSPGLYSSADQKDEYSLCAGLGSEAQQVMRQHRETWITEADFVWLANWGINAIRLPFGYWILDADGPYVASPDLLDQAVNWCEKYDMALILDLHGLPGAQGPEGHTGRSGYFTWPKDAACYAQSLDIIEQIAQRYAGRSCVKAFSVPVHGYIDVPEPFGPIIQA
jgi:glucan 1,3-beta-glucosidase